MRRCSITMGSGRGSCEKFATGILHLGLVNINMFMTSTIANKNKVIVTASIFISGNVWGPTDRRKNCLYRSSCVSRSMLDYTNKYGCIIFGRAPRGLL